MIRSPVVLWKHVKTFAYEIQIPEFLRCPRPKPLMRFSSLLGATQPSRRPLDPVDPMDCKATKGGWFEGWGIEDIEAGEGEVQWR